MGSEKIRVYAGPDSMVTAAGLSTRETFDAIKAYRSGCRKVGGMPGGFIDRETFAKLPGNEGARGYTFLEKLFIKVIGDVIATSGITPASGDSLIILSTTKGNIGLLNAEGTVDEKVYLWNLAGAVGNHFGAANTPFVVSNACISGLSAIIMGSRLIAAGKYKHVIVAGGDAVTRFVVSGFESFKSLSSGICRSYDASRDGLTLGEGCGALLLTSDIGLAGECPVEIAGGNVTNDANHISGPSRTGDGLYYAIRNALEDIGLDPSGIDFVNGHGTATIFNDEMESKAFKLAGVDDKPLNSLKPYIGHTLGAAGIVESIICLHQIKEGIVFGVPGFSEVGTSVPLNMSSTHRNVGINACLKTASGFGGCNAAIIFCRTGITQNVARPLTECRQTAENKVEYIGDDFAGFIRSAYKETGEQNMKFYKMDDLCKLGYIAAAGLLRDKNIDLSYAPDEVGIILSNRSSSLASDLRHQRIVESKPAEGASPSVFVYTLPNIVAGEICIRHKIQGDNTFFVCEEDGGDLAEQYARLLVENGYLKAAVCGICEHREGYSRAYLKLLETRN